MRTKEAHAKRNARGGGAASSRDSALPDTGLVGAPEPRFGISLR